MKAKELVEILMRYPEAKIVVPGYEMWMDAVDEVILTQIVLSGGCGRIFGMYDAFDPSDSEEDKQSPEQAIYLAYSKRGAIDIPEGETLWSEAEVVVE